MTLKEDAKVLGSAVIATVVSFGLGVLSILWLDRILTPLLRGTDGDLILFASIAVIVCGSSYVWYRTYCWTFERLDRL